MGFIEKTAGRQRLSGGREVTVTSRLHRQKDKERQRKTEEKGDNVRREKVDSGGDDDDVYYYIRWRLKLEGETENMGVCTKERKVMMMMFKEGRNMMMMMMFITSQFVPTRLARIRPDPTDIGMGLSLIHI